jgi:metallo-beta-lactamase family protein
MKLISHGAAREVTGSCHELQVNGKRILLDCGLFQGKRSEAAKKNVTFDFDPSSDIDAVIVSHSHMDHVGRIPLLYKRGYRGSVYCTYATKDLAHVMLQDSGYIHEKDEEYFCKHLASSMMKCEGPLYTQQDAIDCGEIFVGRNYGNWFDVCEGIKAKFFEAGHVLGAAMVVLEVTDEEDNSVKTLCFTGDLGRDMLPIIRDPQEIPPVDTLICESTYGNREHEGIETAKHELRDAISRTAERGGKILIPAFSLERTQEIIYDLHLLWDAGDIPQIPIIVDSPLASRVTKIFMKHPECYDKEIYEKFLAKAQNPFQFSGVRYTESVEESKDINQHPGPMIIMAGSGMCEGGRIRHHLRHNIEDPKSTVIAVGYMAENTLGRRIINPEIKAVKIFDKTYQKKAEVVSINAYSAHAGMSDLDKFIISTEGLKNLFLVHGEEENMQAIATRMGNSNKNLKIIMSEMGIAYDV